jgi:hypothetical protein
MYAHARSSTLRVSNRRASLTSPSTHVKSVITEKIIAAENERLIIDYDDDLASYESQFRAHRTWLDDDTYTSSVLAASM